MQIKRWLLGATLALTMGLALGACPIERKDAVKDQTTSVGTATFTLSAIAPNGSRTVSAAHTSGCTVNYRAISSTGTEWEDGQGVVTNAAGTWTLSRATVYASSNSNALVNFSAGTKAVLTGPVVRDFDVPDWATGANVASASTINLDAATGGVVHVTGTTTIGTVTLTRGPRLVIFDGALTLTHNSTTNNLPGAANIVTVAGDRAVYVGDGTTAYMMTYVRASDVNTTNTATQTLTNKTLTTPVISSISNGGTVTIPSGTDTLVNLAGTQTFTNKTLTTPIINGFNGDTSALNIGSGQFVKDTSGNVGIGEGSPGTFFGVPTRLVVSHNTNGPAYLAIYNANAGASAASALRMLTQTANSYWDHKLADSSGTPFAIEDMGSAVASWSVALNSAIRFSVSAAGVVVPGVDNTQTLGSASFRWSTVYAGTGTINTSDAREKTPVEKLTKNELAAAIALSHEVGGFKWLSEGDAAKRQIGMTAQRVIEVMTANGLDADKYGFIVHDVWEAKGDAPAGDRYGIRYDQLALFIEAGLTERLDRLEHPVLQFVVSDTTNAIRTCHKVKRRLACK